VTMAQPDFVCIVVFRRSRWSPPERCTNGTVWGTPYCERHGGKPDGRAAKARSKAAAAVSGESLRILEEAGLEKEVTMDIISNPRSVDPAVMLLEEVSRSAGIIAWLEAKIASLDEEPGNVEIGGARDGEARESFITEVSTVTTESGTGATGASVDVQRVERKREVTVWWRLLQEERRIAQAAASAALRSNIEERRVRLAERSVNALEAAVAAALMDLGLDPHNERVRAVVGARLREALAEGSGFGLMEGEGGGGTFAAPSHRVIEAVSVDESDRPKPQDF
jgi:hypothetical protein